MNCVDLTYAGETVQFICTFKIFKASKQIICVDCCGLLGEGGIILFAKRYLRSVMGGSVNVFMKLRYKLWHETKKCLRFSPNCSKIIFIYVRLQKS